MQFTTQIPVCLLRKLGICHFNVGTANLKLQNDIVKNSFVHFVFIFKLSSSISFLRNQFSNKAIYLLFLKLVFFTDSVGSFRWVESYRLTYLWTWNITCVLDNENTHFIYFLKGIYFEFNEKSSLHSLKLHVYLTKKKINFRGGGVHGRKGFRNIIIRVLSYNNNVQEKTV